MTSQTPPQAPGPQAVPPGGPGVAQLFDRVRAFGAVRPDEGRWAAGVSAGLARRWGVDPLLVRGGFVLLTLFAGVGLLLYGLGWLFLPHPDGRIHAQEVLRGTVTAGFVGGLLAVLADVGSSGWQHEDWYGPRPFRGGGFVVVALIALGVWWFAGGRHRGGHGRWGSGGPGHWGPGGYGGPGPAAPATSPTGPQAASPAGDGGPPAPGAGPVPPSSGPLPPSSGPLPPSSGPLPPYGTPPAPGATLLAPRPVPVAIPPRPDPSRPSHALTRVVLGTALLAAGAVLAVDRVTGVGAPVGFVAAAAALGVVAIGLLVAGLLGRRGGGLVPIGILLGVVALVSNASTGTVDWAGKRTWTPTTISNRTQYNLGVGEGVLDLTNVTVPPPSTGPVEVDVRVGVGALTVVVPAGTTTTVRVIADAGAGEVRNEAGLAVTARTAPHDGRDASADLDVATAASGRLDLVVRADIGAGDLSIVSNR